MLEPQFPPAISPQSADASGNASGSAGASRGQSVCGITGSGVGQPAGRTGMLGTFRVAEGSLSGLVEQRVGGDSPRVGTDPGNRSGSSPARDETRRRYASSGRAAR